MRGGPRKRVKFNLALNFNMTRTSGVALLLARTRLCPSQFMKYAERIRPHDHSNYCVGSLTELETRKFLTHVSQGLNHIHLHDIVHRDIKAENIFLAANGRAKVRAAPFMRVSRIRRMLMVWCTRRR